MRGKLLLILCAIFLGAMPVLAAESKEEPDWPGIISRLRSQAQDQPGLKRSRRQLALAYNNYGVSLAEEGNWKLAAEQLEEALQLEADNKQFKINLANIHINQAHDVYEARRLADAKGFVQEAIALNPASARAYFLLGEIEYSGQHLKEARKAWERAFDLDPLLDGLKERLEQLNDELPVESKFGRLSQAYFDLRYEESERRPTGFDVRDALLRARRQVGSDFAYWPKYKIVVLIYSAESFRTLRSDAAAWVAGQYDGKIRIPLPNGKMDEATVKQVIFHEYTHAIVNDLTHGSCPVWFNEGIAEYEGARYGPLRFEYLSAALAEERLLKWDALDSQFSAGMPAQKVALAYQESHSIVQYLVERYGFWRIRRILKALSAGENLNDIFKKECHLAADQLESKWRDWLPKLLRT